MSGSASSRDRRNADESSVLDHETLDPNKHYRFFHTSDARIARARALGYTTVKYEDGVKLLTDQSDDDGTGAILQGDRVLMQIPKEKYETRRRRKQQIATQRLSGPAERFREEASKRGARIASEKLRDEPADEE